MLIHCLLTKPSFFTFLFEMRHFIHICKKLREESIMLSPELGIMCAICMVTYQPAVCFSSAPQVFSRDMTQWRSLTLLQAVQGMGRICSPILNSFESIIAHKRCRDILSCQHNTKGAGGKSKINCGYRFVRRNRTNVLIGNSWSTAYHS